MTRPLIDKAEVALEYPDKLYIGTFERSARFDAHLDESGVSLALFRPGEADVRKSVHMHFHYALFADILNELAKTAAAMPADDLVHRDDLRAAAQALARSLGRSNDDKAAAEPQSGDGSVDEATGLSPKEEVMLLHVLE
jgi:hypothetical protein